MTIYQKSTSQPFKWIIAIIVFILAMTITFDDVEGINIPPKGDNYSSSKPMCNNSAAGVNEGEDDSSHTYPPITAVPEPSTIIIMAAGLGALRLSRKFLNKQSA